MEDVAGRLDGRAIVAVAERLRPRLGTVRFRYRLLASLTGYGITAFVLGWSLLHHGIGNDAHVWDRVGGEVAAGISPYYPAEFNVANFFYAPPIALAFGAVSWLPIEALALLMFAISVAALRYLAGSWLRVGYCGLCLVVGGELAEGSINLVIAAAIAAAVRGDGRWAALAALAKLSPILAVREWRRPLAVVAVAVGATLPVAELWLGWIAQLAHATTLGLGYPIPWLPRLALALALVALVRRPWARGLAAVIAIPSLYIYSVVLLFALLPQLRRTSVVNAAILPVPETALPVGPPVERGQLPSPLVSPAR